MIGELNQDPIICVEHLKYVYPSGTEALKDICLKVYPGEFVALIGQNGAGKTTLTKHFNALLRPTKGDVWVAGLNTRQQRTSQLARKVGYVFQNPDHMIFSETVWDEVAFGPKQLGVEGEELELVVDLALKRLELLKEKDNHPYMLSKGQRQRVAVASIVAMRPEILVIDEPTTGQDYKQSREIMSLFVDLNKEGKTVIVVTHDMGLVASYAKRTVVMGQSEILLEGATAEVFSQVDVLHSTHLRPPQITTLGFKLNIQETVLTVPRMAEILSQEGALS